MEGRLEILSRRYIRRGGRYELNAPSVIWNLWVNVLKDAIISFPRAV